MAKVLLVTAMARLNTKRADAMRKSVLIFASTFTAAISSFAYAHVGHNPAHSQSSHGQQQRAFPDPATVAEPEGISISECWIRAMPSRLPAAAYFRIENAGKEDAVLVGAQADGFGKVMLHTHEESGGMARMVHVDEVIVPASGAFDFAPRGHHLMLERAQVDLDIGSRRDITLWFEGPKAITVACDVRPPGTLK